MASMTLAADVELHYCFASGAQQEIAIAFEVTRTASKGTSLHVDRP